LYPTISQESLLNQFVGAKRWLYNYLLSEQKRRHLAGEKHLSEFDCHNLIPPLKKQSDTAWLKDIDSWALQNASSDLATAYKNFFDSVKGKRKGKKVSAPEYKRKGGRESYRTRGIKVDFQNNKVFLPKIKFVKCILHREFVGVIKSATVSKNPTGEWYISILVEEPISLKPMSGQEVGIDLGLKDLAILSSGVKFEHPQQMLAKAKQALKKEQRTLARKTKGSKNREKQRIKVSKAYARVTRIRNEYYHILSKWLVETYDAIYLEDLNVSGMLKNRKLARKIAESAWSTLKSMIEYKAGYAGKTVHSISRWYPSSKTCSSCGHKMATMGLEVREWTCPSCGVDHDRDLNAALNILYQGQKDLYDAVQPSRATMEVGVIPMALQKHSVKIERSGSRRSSWNGEQASLTIFSR
jgi:putative transposase